MVHWIYMCCALGAASLGGLSNNIKIDISGRSISSSSQASVVSCVATHIQCTTHVAYIPRAGLSNVHSVQVHTRPFTLEAPPPGIGENCHAKVCYRGVAKVY